MLQVAKARKLERVIAHMSTPVHPNRRPVVFWTPPTSSCYKVNFDGATFTDEGSAGLRVVIRNNGGLVMSSLSQLIPLPLTVIKGRNIGG